MDFVSTHSFLTPESVPEQSWAEHIPFGFWLVNVLEPEVLADAGNENGYLRFVRDALARKIGTATVVQCAADAPTIDLLSVRNEAEFLAFRAKLSPRAVVLVHDAMAATVNYPCFDFTHAGGLRVIGYGESQTPQLQRFFAASAEAAAAIRFVYDSLGRYLALRRDELRKRESLLERLGAELDAQRRDMQGSHDAEVNRLRHELKRTTAAAAHYQGEYEKAISSRSWKLTRPLREGSSLSKKLNALFHSSQEQHS